jgi:2-polyprenyl-3-methyl-5-hydroxy-6-metoxy-1,4-benzoquinol methylase
MSKWSEFLHNITLFESAFHKAKLINTIMRYAPRGAKLLETGFGSGKTAILLSDIGYNVTAIDLDDELVYGEISKTLRKFGVKVKKMDIIKTDFKDCAFDVVFHQGVLEHFDDGTIVRALRENGRVGDIVIFHVPNNRLIRQPFGDERCLSIRHWKRLIRESGLDLKEVIGDQPNPIFHFILPHFFYTKKFAEKIYDIPSRLMCRSTIFIAQRKKIIKTMF